MCVVFAEATPQERAEIIAEIRETRWRGMLPPPESFNAYPEWVQREIVSLAKRGAENIEAIIESSIRLDASESDRLDRLVEADRKQVTAAQLGTIAINLSLVAAAALAAWRGESASVGLIIGGLAVVNVATLTIGKSSQGGKEDKRTGEGENPQAR